MTITVDKFEWDETGSEETKIQYKDLDPVKLITGRPSQDMCMGRPFQIYNVQAQIGFVLL